MITKVFFIVLVIVVVGIIFNKQRTPSQASPSPSDSTNKRNSFSTSNIAYGLIAVLILVSSVLYYFNRSDANRIITLNVLDASSTLTQYQAYNKDIKGRTFTTIDGRQVQLAETDRLEIINQ